MEHGPLGTPMRAFSSALAEATVDDARKGSLEKRSKYGYKYKDAEVQETLVYMLIPP